MGWRHEAAWSRIGTQDEAHPRLAARQVCRAEVASWFGTALRRLIMEWDINATNDEVILLEDSDGRDTANVA